MKLDDQNYEIALATFESRVRHGHDFPEAFRDGIKSYIALEAEKKLIEKPLRGWYLRIVPASRKAIPGTYYVVARDKLSAIYQAKRLAGYSSDSCGDELNVHHCEALREL